MAIRLRDVGLRFGGGLVLSAVAAVCLLAAVLMAGVAVVLQASASAAGDWMRWVLIVAPLVPLVVAVASVSALVLSWRRPSLVRMHAL